MEPPLCKNIRSRRHPDQRCSNPATNGDYCGVHNKHPRPFVQEGEQKQVNEIISLPINTTLSAKKIKGWLKKRANIKKNKRQGPAYSVPEVSNNTTDFFSMEEISTIPKSMLFSFIDEEKKVYSFDVRSIAMLLEQKPEDGEYKNPYTRQAISEANLQKAMKFIRWCRKKGIDTRWKPIEPSSPDQAFQLKVTDLFQKIDELSYYTNAQWFIKLSISGLRRFYVELNDIWYHRAGLTNEMRSIIIPAPARPFRFTIREVLGLKNIELLRKINLDMIRMFISAAKEKSDRGIGAMYVLTALTLVSKDCAGAYPWLFESAMPGVYNSYAALEEPDGATLNFLNAILNGNPMFLPLLQLPPPTNT
jgi:hypothetical protein